MSKLSKAYRIIKSKTPDSLFKVKLLKNSGFPGVEIEFTGIIMADEPSKYLKEEDKAVQKELKKELKKNPKAGNNAQLKYDIVKIPGRKFQNMKDSKKAEFEKVVGDIFIDAILSAAPKTLEE